MVFTVTVPSRLERVSKLLARRGLCSRREAAAFIRQGYVLLDGQPVRETGAKALPEQRIELAPAAQRAQNQAVTIILNKPLGYVSGSPEAGNIPAMVLLRPENQAKGPGQPRFSPTILRGLAPAGRLDIDSQGLIVFTQDGRVARQLIGADSRVEKEYLARVEGTLNETGLTRLRHGLELDGRALKPAVVEWLNRDQLRFVLLEGRKRQIRRMCSAVGLRVLGLKRVRIGKIRLGGLPEGRWRFLNPGEAF
jgi:23S rRNA pseudouridine2604 synthase